MAFYTENALMSAPGVIFSELDGGGMIHDRDSGEYLPAEQVIRDPLRLAQIDLLEQDHLGCLRWNVLDEPEDADLSALHDNDVNGDDFGNGVENYEDSRDFRDFDPYFSRSDFPSEAHELQALVSSQRLDDLGADLPIGKGRFANLGVDKDDNGRLYRFNSHGPRGRQPKSRSRATISGRATFSTK